jgi:hypothetical protein
MFFLKQRELGADSTVVTTPFLALALCQKKLSILLDTHSHKEQDHVDVSRFEAKLPLRSAKVVSLKAKHRIEREDPEPTRFFLVPSRGAHPPVRRTGSAHPRRQRFQVTPLKPESLPARGNIEFLKKEN